ncbi:unnamed protein product, partial [Allacma fusca]
MFHQSGNETILLVLIVLSDLKLVTSSLEDRTIDLMPVIENNQNCLVHLLEFGSYIDYSKLNLPFMLTKANKKSRFEILNLMPPVFKAAHMNCTNTFLLFLESEMDSWKNFRDAKYKGKYANTTGIPGPLILPQEFFFICLRRNARIEWNTRSSCWEFDLDLFSIKDTSRLTPVFGLELTDQHALIAGFFWCWFCTPENNFTPTLYSR